MRGSQSPGGSLYKRRWRSVVENIFSLLQLLLVVVTVTPEVLIAPVGQLVILQQVLIRAWPDLISILWLWPCLDDLTVHGNLAPGRCQGWWRAARPVQTRPSSRLRSESCSLDNLDLVAWASSDIGILSLDWLTRPPLHGKLHRTGYHEDNRQGPLIISNSLIWTQLKYTN